MATAATNVQATRKGERRRVLMRGTVFGPDGAHIVWIRDISSDGALVSADDRLPDNCDVIFKRGSLFAAGRMAWTNDNGAGIKFYRDLADCEVAAAELPLPNRDY
ncbi:MAG TPA: PilZ domain-containing protein [Sphingomicrobium sp.]|nr:PilZ domain-containing protein [Sphingomicrobium sp.]